MHFINILPAIKSSIMFFYYTLPGGTPKALTMHIQGEYILREVPDVFTKRYGAPTKIKYESIWMTETGCAMLPTNASATLEIISKAAYEEVNTFIAEFKVKQEAKRKAEAEQYETERKAFRDKL